MTRTHRILMLVAASALTLGTAACSEDSNADSTADSEGGDSLPPASPLSGKRARRELTVNAIPPFLQLIGSPASRLLLACLDACAR